LVNVAILGFYYVIPIIFSVIRAIFSVIPIIFSLIPAIFSAIPVIYSVIPAKAGISQRWRSPGFPLLRE